jgi:parvulin-like peptidyl-prolyl isomerase
MFMRSIRANTKWVMMVMAVAFAAWLVLDWVNQKDQAATLGVNPVVATINGQEIRNSRWSEAYSFAIDRARAVSGRSLNDEETRQIESDAWEAMIQDILVEQEIERLGIEVTETEIRQAFRTSPPPDLMRHPAFQTSGTFDYSKYQDFFRDPSVDEQLLMQIEMYYRQTLPRTRLAQQISGGTAMSDGEVWQAYRDQNESATVSYISTTPEALTLDSEIEISEADARQYYRQNVDQFVRPATAVARLASFSTTPTAVDTAATAAVADSVRTAIEAGELTFDEAAAEFSSDSLTATSGGILGRFAGDQLVESIAEAVSDLAVGDISSPVLTPAGYRIFTVTERVQDTVAVAHILFAVVLSEAGEDEIFRTMDEFEGIALNRGVTAAGDELGVPVRSDVTLTDGFDFVPGAGSLGVGVDWAVDPLTPLEEVSEFFENGSGFHMLEVVSRTEEGTFLFEEVRPQIEETLRAQRRAGEALEIAAGRLDEVRAAPSLEAAAESLGWTYGQAGPFLRGQFVQGLGRGTEAVGAAFGASPGTIQGPYDAGDAIVILRVDQRTEADIERFQVMRGQLRAQMESQMSQTSVDRWVQALREDAEIVDLRDRLRAPEQV